MNQDKFEKKLAALLSDQTGHPEIVRDWYNFVKSFIAAESALASLVDHPRYRGDEREQTISKLLERIVPTNLLVQRGFVINSHLQTSQEQDILLIEGSKCTEIRSASSARYFPAESICSIIEVKSKISPKEFRKSVLSCVSAKKVIYDGLKLKLPAGESPTLPIYTIFAFSASSDLENVVSTFKDLVVSIEPKFRPNLVYVLNLGGIFPIKLSKDGKSAELQLEPKSIEAPELYGCIREANAEVDSYAIILLISYIISHAQEVSLSDLRPNFTQYSFRYYLEKSGIDPSVSERYFSALSVPFSSKKSSAADD